MLFDLEIASARGAEPVEAAEAEDPMLQVAWDETLQQISLRVMGEIQLEILKGVILDRFGLEVTFGDCRILYLKH